MPLLKYSKNELPFVQLTLGNPEIMVSLKKIAIDLFILGITDERVERAFRYVNDLRIESIIAEFLIPAPNSETDAV